jgi:hypothetical protein
MRLIRAAALGGLLAASGALAQQPQNLPATTVQLPSFSFFSVNTTVSVPDRGGMYLGGVNRARDGSWTRGFGPLANRAIGGDRMAGGASVHATIIDHEELDRATLAAAAAKRGAVDPDAVKAEALARHVGRVEEPIAATSGRASGSAGASPSHEALPDSVAAIKARNAAAAEERALETAKYFAQAEQAESEGKAAIAKIYYQMVARRDGALKQQAEERLAALKAKSPVKAANR